MVALGGMNPLGDPRGMAALEGNLSRELVLKGGSSFMLWPLVEHFI